MMDPRQMKEIVVTTLLQMGAPYDAFPAENLILGTMAVESRFCSLALGYQSGLPSLHV